MPLNVEQALIDAVRAAVELRVPRSADNPIAAGAVRDFRWADYAGTVQQGVQTEPNAFPWVGGSVTGTSWRRRPATFGDMLGPDELRMGEPGTVTLRLVAVFDTVIEAEQTPLEAAVEAALFSLGPKLGIRWVGGVATRKTRNNENTRETGNVRRMVAAWSLSVDVRPGNHLLAAS